MILGQLLVVYNIKLNIVVLKFDFFSGCQFKLLQLQEDEYERRRCHLTRCGGRNDINARPAVGVTGVYIYWRHRVDCGDGEAALA